MFYLVLVVWGRGGEIVFSVPGANLTLNGPGGKKKLNTPLDSNRNYRTEMKLKRINTNSCLLPFDPIKFPFRIRPYKGVST